MAADGIEAGQTYRVTEAGLKSHYWPKRWLGDVFYIAYINGYKFSVVSVKAGWENTVYRDDMHLFERAGFHPNWNRVLRDQTMQQILSLASKKRDAKKLLAELPDTILGYESEMAQLKHKLARLQKERKQSS